MSGASEARRLVFVYNADADFFNAMMDSAHKLLSPGTYDCRLCALTHGALTMKRQWADFLGSLAIPNYPRLKVDLPAIFLEQGAEMRLLVDAATLNRQSTLNELKETLSRAASGSARS